MALFDEEIRAFDHIPQGYGSEQFLDEGLLLVAAQASLNALPSMFASIGRRLMEPGGWLGLGETRAWTREEPYKLARLRIDLPNTADAEWKIDVRKSTALPPDFLKARLRDLALHV